jgi:hypothetical protein
MPLLPLLEQNALILIAAGLNIGMTISNMQHIYFFQGKSMQHILKL